MTQHDDKNQTIPVLAIYTVKDCLRFNSIITNMELNRLFFSSSRIV